MSERVLGMTKNGKPNFMVLSYEDDEHLQNSIVLLKWLTLSEKSASKMGFISVEQAFLDD